MKTCLKLIIAFAVIILVLVVAVRSFIFRSEETGPVYVEAVSDDGFLKLTMTLGKTKFTVSPREAVEINLTLTNVGDQEITLTFHYRSKFDFMIFDYAQGAYAYRWSYDHIQGPVGWSANASTYPVSITLEASEIDTIVLRPSEKISQTLIWDQKGEYTGMFDSIMTVPKGRYRVEGFAGFGRWPYSGYPDNPERFFEYVLPDGTLVSAVLQTPGVDISLV